MRTKKEPPTTTTSSTLKKKDTSRVSKNNNNNSKSTTTNASGKLKVCILSAKDFQLDPGITVFINIRLSQQVTAKRRTQDVKSTDMIWNSEFIFNLNPENSCALVFRIWGRENPVFRGELLGVSNVSLHQCIANPKQISDLWIEVENMNRSTQGIGKVHITLQYFEPDDIDLLPIKETTKPISMLRSRNSDNENHHHHLHLHLPSPLHSPPREPKSGPLEDTIKPLRGEEKIDGVLKVYLKSALDLLPLNSPSISVFITIRMGSAGLAIEAKNKQRSNEVKGNSTFTWNEEFVFPVVDLESLELMFRIWDKERFGSSKLLGTVSIPLSKFFSFNKSLECNVWEDVLPEKVGKLNIGLEYKSYKEKSDHRKKVTLAEQDFTHFKSLLAKHDPQKLPETVSSFPKSAKQLVSQKKKRFKDDKYDLDLAYITERIIAMGYPSTGYEKIYRNQMEDVQAFLKDYHQSHYKVYNLCSERNYPPSKFLNFSAFPFDDHNVPPLEKIYSFCEDASSWLDQNGKNVIAVHCKAGKGRTGMMICALLVYKYPEKLDIDTAFSFYGNRRTLDGKGVTIPSQIRFAQYFFSTIQSFKDGTWETEKDAIKDLVSIQINSPPKTFTVWYVITTTIEGKIRTYETDKELIKKYKDASKIIFPINCLVNRETKVIFYSEDSKAKPIFYFWFHSKFITDKLELDKRSLDKLNDKELYDGDFSITLNFANVDPQDLPARLQALPSPKRERVSTRKEFVNNTFNNLRRVRTAAIEEDQNKSPTTSSADDHHPVHTIPIIPPKPTEDPPIPSSSPSPSSPPFSPLLNIPSLTSPLLEEFIAQKSQMGPNLLLLPALRDSQSHESTSESTSYSTDYSTESLGKTSLSETDSLKEMIPPEEDELLGVILKDIAIKNNNGMDL